MGTGSKPMKINLELEATAEYMRGQSDASEYKLS